MIVVDTGGALALLNRDDRFHEAVVRAYDETGKSWVFPWAVLPELDYLARTRLGQKVADRFVEELRDGLFRMDTHAARDLPRAVELMKRHAALDLGLVDAVVMAQAERLKARAIVTTDGRHFRALRLNISPPPKLVPLD